MGLYNNQPEQYGRWMVSLGYEGPTDACLVLTHPDGYKRQASIESGAWIELSKLWFGAIGTEEKCQEIWEMNDW